MVTLSDHTTASPTFIAPATITQTATLTITLVVNDSLGLASQPFGENFELLGILDASLPGFVGEKDLQFFASDLVARDVVMNGDTAYVLQGMRGAANKFWGQIRRIDLSDLQNLVFIDSYGLPRPTGLLVRDSTQYLSEDACQFDAMPCKARQPAGRAFRTTSPLTTCYNFLVPSTGRQTDLIDKFTRIKAQQRQDVLVIMKLQPFVSWGATHEAISNLPVHFDLACSRRLHS
jgi:hypothetical protein